jgi:hypothetical protein
MHKQQNTETICSCRSQATRSDCTVQRSTHALFKINTVPASQTFVHSNAKSALTSRWLLLLAVLALITSRALRVGVQQT